MRRVKCCVLLFCGSEELKDFLDDAKEGFIYFSLGGNVKSKDLKGQTMINIIQTLKELPYKVLWKFEADGLPEKPANIKLIKWAPQQDILRHPNIKLFIGQGGIQSIEEAIFTHVPLLIMPFYGDQLKNAKIVENRGIGKFVHHKPVLIKEEFKDAIIEVSNNTKYKKNIKRLAQLIKDTPMTGLETSVWWTEYVIRNKGAKHLRNPAADIPSYQYYLIDVIAFLIAVLVAVIVTFVVAVKKVLQFIKYLQLRKKDKVKTK